MRAIFAFGLAVPAAAGDGAALDRLVRAYPEQLAGHDGTVLVWRDGTRMQADDGVPGKTEDEAIDHGSILDQLRPDPVDPGRVRNRAFFDKLYGDCHAGGVEPELVAVRWLPEHAGQSVRATTVEGVADALAAVSAELDALPDKERRYVLPSAGAYNCRSVARTTRPSMHAYGAAIDVNTRLTNSWTWGGPPRPVPPSVVAIFAQHGFIWGGNWTHFDTMHFEYRPELLPGYAASRSSAASSASPMPVVPVAVQPGPITSGVRSPDASTSAQARSTSDASSSSPNE